MTTSVFLLDDHEIVRRGLRDLIEATGDLVIVGESGSAAEATRHIPALRPDVAVLDARLPDGSGIDVCRDIRSVDPTIRVLILTSYDDERALVASVLAGASGYLLKALSGEGIVEAIRRVAGGDDLTDQPQVKALREGWSARAETDPRLRSLSPTERRILDLIADGLTNRQIGEHLGLAEKTVKNYVSTVLAKMGMERRTQAAVYAATHRKAEPPPGA
ncbi:LuxR family two component transcriptional regulator [Humibacillus xanthopallidus]|uniref:LuxR family two component transcriptional regulator n=1 Tax=Humibacillus xanthopallidus TaxID=412689 RepID=A0A543PPT4_9MICO|nr:response regulator transcription factor [Humibacillus xanthopallidus]TQN46099.1 LuxR family two component transcriptional regulator [Humibacillus xanthopallidus]HET7799207.1 response regulator transcription factor [Humibacillus xanthopallidus]